MRSILTETLNSYLSNKKEQLKSNIFAKKFTHIYSSILKNYLNDQDFITKFSIGKGNWADCPWFAILDPLVTDSPQNGYYIVYLFTEDMSGVYLSLNQGVTEILNSYKGDKHNILKIRAQNYRAKIEWPRSFSSGHMNLKTTRNNAKARYYESGDIISKYYPANQIPSDTELLSDLNLLISKYRELIMNDNEEVQVIDHPTLYESKKLKLHYRIERNAGLVKKVKSIKGYKCEACAFTFNEKYKDLGDHFIEAHHLIPIASLEIGIYPMDPIKDFAVLCSNCHRMIHKLKDPSNLKELKRIIES